MQKIYCFGNEYIKNDEIAKQIADELKIVGYELIKADSPHAILDAKDDLVLLDVVKGIDKVTKIQNPDDIVLSNTLTCHDLDLAFYIKLFREIKKINNITIIGIPYGHNNKEDIKNQITLILK